MDEEQVKGNEDVEVPAEENQDIPDTEISDTADNNDTGQSDQQTVEVIDTPEAVASSMSYNVAVIFVLSMILGLLIFNTLSRRWSS